jgi:hypothetical protein
MQFSSSLLIYVWIAHTIEEYLVIRYPIRSIDGKHSIPTVPYVWPNGQGDVAKFLKGEENGNAWGKEFGRIYRIWNGTVGEV